MGECGRCYGTGWVIVRKSTVKTRMTYGDKRELDFAEPCPDCNGGEAQRIAEVKERANIPRTYYDVHIDDFKWDIYKDESGNPANLDTQKKLVTSFIDNFPKWEEKGIGFYIYSKVRGTGKTYLASCICNTIMRKYKITTKFVSASELINLAKTEVKGGKNAIDVLCECGLLVLDDIGQKTTGEDWMNDILFKIIETRHQNKRVTLFTSNLQTHELKIDDRISSRLDKMTQNIPLPNYSFRKKEADDEKRKFYKEIGLM